MYLALHNVPDIVSNIPSSSHKLTDTFSLDFNQNLKYPDRV